jgi:hypothetical protein
MRVIRWVVFSVASIAFLALLSRYDSLPNEIAARLGRSPEAELAEAITVLRDRDPKAADALQSLTDARRRRAIEAMLRAEKRLPGGDSIRVAERLAKDVGQGTDSASVDAARYELALLASDPHLVRTRAERDSFIAGNATVVDAIGSVRTIGDEGSAVADVAIADYLSDVEKVAASPASYRAVADDPIGVMLFDEERDAKLRQFYLTANANHDNPDWLKAVIAQTVQPSGSGDSPFRLTSLAKGADEDEDGTDAYSVGDVVRIAYDNHPLFQQTFFDDLQLPEDDRRPAPVVVALYREHGELIRLATGPKGNVPRSEILDVLFANDDFLERWRIEKGETDKATLELVAHFADLQKSKPGVWREARYSPLALQLDEAAPRHANEVLEQYGPDDIATLLLSGYEESAAKATEAVARFGDIAIVVLQMYADEAAGNAGLFHRALRNPDVGVRIVPFVASKGDDGLTKLESDIGWLDKYFHPDGRPRDEVVWYEAVPIVGAPAKVAANLVHGHPSTWEELGWAAVDVADGALLVATFGASAAKAPAQQAAKQAAKQAGKQAAKAAAIQSGRRLATNTTRLAARQARKQLGRSLLRGAAALRLVGKTAVITGKAVSAAWKAFKYVLSATYKACATVIRTADDIRRVWGRVPQSVRRAVYGGLLASSMYVRARDRTLPNTHLVGEELGRFAGKTVTAAGKTGATMFAAAIDEVFGHPPQWLVGWIAYAGMCVVTAVIAWQARPWLRRRVVYV